LTADHDSRVIEFYVDEFDEILTAGDIAVVLIWAVREAILVQETNPRLGEREKPDDRLPTEHVLEKEDTSGEIDPAQRVSSDSNLLGQAMPTTQ
jgi:hypothetical protein